MLCCAVLNATQCVDWPAGADWSILNPASSWPRHERFRLYGKNEMSAGKPRVRTLAFEFFTLPWYLVQVSAAQQSQHDAAQHSNACHSTAHV